MITLLEIDFENDHDYLVPFGLSTLPESPSYDFDELSLQLNLALTILRSERFDWLEAPHLVQQVRCFVDSARGVLRQLSDDAEQTDDSRAYYRVLISTLEMEVKLFEALVGVEQRISKIEPSG